ncbi:CLIP domain-containing serine protease HP8-like [Pieris napi]|uniref:CLIP domain-containing serine protease HP8-like n=1 Tax=Pieris napi TaxID=78633 RepID=UPI001FBAB13A|nr:CLIP domain-containing serine protease HP8-like [Pieris napi]
MLIKIAILVFQFYIVHSWRKCDDCIMNLACPGAYNITSFFKTPDSLLQLYQGICGFDGTAPMVCCSDFASPEIHSRMNHETDVDTLFYENESNDLLPTMCGISSYAEDRIYGGKSAELHEFPWMALISTFIDSAGNKQFTCGGTIINSKYILTAAHCVVGKKLAGVRVGEHKIGAEDCTLDKSICEDFVQNFYIETYIPHERYLSNGEKNRPSFDIALIRLEGEIDFSPDNVVPICLPLHKEFRESNLLGEEAVVAGWGAIETGTQSTELLKVKIKIHNDASCQGINNTICAGTRGRDSCKADSGGPLMIRHPESYRYVQYGIVSFGNTDCGTGSAVYTDVRKYIDWILDNMEE